MGMFKASIQRSNSKTNIRKEDMLFPYDIDELNDLFVYSPPYNPVLGSTNTYYTIINFTKYRKINWFFQDHAGQILAFGKELCLILKKFSSFIMKIPAWSIVAKGKYNIIGTYMTNGCNIHMSTPDNSVIIVYDENIKGSSYKILK